MQYSRKVKTAETKNRPGLPGVKPGRRIDPRGAAGGDSLWESAEVCVDCGGDCIMTHRTVCPPKRILLYLNFLIKKGIWTLKNAKGVGSIVRC